MTSDTPVAVPPDQAPLRALGDLQGTLARLQEFFGEFWTLVDAGGMNEGQRHRDSRTVGQLIATAVQQAEALPQPEGDLAGEMCPGCAGTGDAFAVGCTKCKGSGRVPTEGDLAAFVAAMPAQPDSLPVRVNAGLLKALRKRHVHSLSWPCGIECDAAAAIAAAEEVELAK